MPGRIGQRPGRRAGVQVAVGRQRLLGLADERVELGERAEPGCTEAEAVDVQRVASRADVKVALELPASTTYAMSRDRVSGGSSAWRRALVGSLVLPDAPGPSVREQSLDCGTVDVWGPIDGDSTFCRALDATAEASKLRKQVIAGLRANPRQLHDSERTVSPTFGDRVDLQAGGCWVRNYHIAAIAIPYAENGMFLMVTRAFATGRAQRDSLFSRRAFVQWHAKPNTAFHEGLTILSISPTRC